MVESENLLVEIVLPATEETLREHESGTGAGGRIPASPSTLRRKQTRLSEAAVL